MEAEYIAMAFAFQETLWLQKLLHKIGQLVKSKPILTFADNQGSMALAKNPGNHPHTKHIDTKFHFTCEVIASKAMSLQYISTDLMMADILTKSLGRPKHKQFSQAVLMSSSHYKWDCYLV